MKFIGRLSRPTKPFTLAGTFRPQALDDPSPQLRAEPRGDPPDHADECELRIRQSRGLLGIRERLEDATERSRDGGVVERPPGLRARLAAG